MRVSNKRRITMCSKSLRRKGGALMGVSVCTCGYCNNTIDLSRENGFVAHGIHACEECFLNNPKCWPEKEEEEDD